MFDIWLRMGTFGIVVVPFVLLYIVATGIVWVTHLSPARPFFASCIGITGPFFASVAVLFGLFAAFLSSDVQHRDNEFKAAVFHEADGIRTILRLAEALGPAGADVGAAAIGYTRSVVNEEWPAMLGRSNTAEDLGALRSQPLGDLTLAVLAPKLTAALPAAAHQAIIDGLVEVRQGRLERLMLSAGISDPTNWLAMLILGLLTQIAIAVVQLERMRPQALALLVFTTAFAATVALIGLSEQQVAGRQSDAAPLRAALASATP